VQEYAAQGMLPNFNDLLRTGTIGGNLMQVVIDYIAAHSPVAPVVEGRIVGP
jgi:hypothetical protein